MLEGVAAALSSGFSRGLEEARAEAPGEQQAWIDEFLVHIRASCDAVTALERAPQAFYAPARGATLAPPPDWWSGLTVEVWFELLENEPEFVGDIQVECRGGEPELPPTKGVPVVVAGAVELLVRGNGSDGQPLDALLERSQQKNKDGFPRRLSVDQEAEFVDAAPPEHKSPLKYTVSADGCRPASVKVISLGSWTPGISWGAGWRER